MKTIQHASPVVKQVTRPVGVSVITCMEELLKAEMNFVYDVILVLLGYMLGILIRGWLDKDKPKMRI